MRPTCVRIYATAQSRADIISQVNKKQETCGVFSRLLLLLCCSAAATAAACVSRLHKIMCRCGLHLLDVLLSSSHVRNCDVDVGDALLLLPHKKLTYHTAPPVHTHTHLHPRTHTLAQSHVFVISYCFPMNL